MNKLILKYKKSAFKNSFILLIAIFSPLIAGISDYFLLFHPNLFSKAHNYQFLFDISSRNSWIGVLLGSFSIPFLWITYKNVLEFLDFNSKKQIQKLESLVKIMIINGFIVHLMYFFIPLYFKEAFQIEFFSLLFFKFLEISFVLMYIYYMYKWTIISFIKENTIMHHSRFFNPFIYLIFILIITLVNKNLGIVLLVSFFNVSFFIVFLGVYIYKNKQNRY